MSEPLTADEEAALQSDLAALRVSLPVIKAGGYTTTISVSMLERLYKGAERAAPTLYFDGNPLVSRAVLRREDNPGVTFTATELGTGKYAVRVE